MATIKLVIAKLQGLSSAIDDALQNEVAERARDALVIAATENVYSYQASPEAMRKRRYAQGGIQDRRNMTADVSNNTLVMTDDAPPQNRGTEDDDLGDMPLRKAIATGYHQGNAGKRPFHGRAKKILMEMGWAKRALEQGLRRQGYSL